MHVVTWILTGVLVAWLVRLVRGGLGASLLTDLMLGLLGALLGGWLVRLSGAVEPGAGWEHVLAAMLGSLLVVSSGRLALHLTARAAAHSGTPRTAGALEGLARVARRGPVARDPNQAFDQQLTLGQRMADRLAAFGGSWFFLGLFAATMLGWMIFNTERTQPFDPYPFILLNLVLSCLAAVQAPVILMSQNRQTEKDRHDARLDYELNLKAELEIDRETHALAAQLGATCVIEKPFDLAELRAAVRLALRARGADPSRGPDVASR